MAVTRVLLSFARLGTRTRVVDVPFEHASSLCGRRLDWLEVPPAG
jgi:hypothetical protein